MKKSILMIPVWYPKEGSIAGIFFKEQAELLAQKYFFQIMVLENKISLLPRRPTLFNKNKSENIIEYRVNVYYTPVGKIMNVISNYLQKRKRTIEGVGVYYSNRYKKKKKKQIKEIINCLEYEYDIVYGISSQGIAYEAKLFSEASNKPLVLGEHGPFPWPGTTMDNLTKESLESADCFVAISNDKIRQIMLQNVKLKKVKYVGNLVDESLFKYELENGKNCIEKTLLIVAANSFYKNYDMFIGTMNRLVEKTSYKFKIIVAGYGANKGYSKNIEELERKIMNSKFSKYVELIREVPRNEMPELYKKADAFVMTSIQEGQPVSAIEAACCGLPIFTTRCGGVEDYISNDIGRIVSIIDAEGLSEYLRQYIEGEILFDRMKIREKAVSLFGREAFMNNMIDTFENV